MIEPKWGIWFVLTALIPVALRVVSGGIRFRSIDWLAVVFLLTAWAGYWAAYDQSAAWNKAWLIVTSVLLYFSLKAQPKENLIPLSVFLFCLGVGISLYYFLTHDFIAAPRKLEFVNQLGRWIMSVRPRTGWTPIHPNYVAGMIAITVPFILHPVWINIKNNAPIPSWLLLAIVLGSGISALALVMATSRGVVFAVLVGAGGLLLRRVVNSDRIGRQIKNEAVFPVLLFVYLCAMLAFLYAGPARSGSIFSGNYYYGDGSRAELFSRSLYLLFAFPITGGGLGSFPGLYSQYLLDIPFFNVSNSHNLFLDVGIEQGLLGGLSFFSLYVAALWTVARAIAGKAGDRTFQRIVLFSLIVAFVHGMVDDYLYNSVGAVLALFLVGLAMNGQSQSYASHKSRIDLRTAAVIAAVWALVLAVNLNQIRAIWYANLGAVQLAKVELAGFPNNGWAGYDITARLNAADASLRSALRFDPANRTANQRLGIISMYRRNFDAAVKYLETARVQTPAHRGIIKLLAYSYIWKGDIEKAREFLSQIPEAREELDVYVWWWKAQGRSDLSENAKLALAVLINAPSQP